MTIAIPQYAVKAVHRSNILVLPHINSRKELNVEKIKRLASSIEQQGLIHLPLLMQRSQTDIPGTEWYLLVAGFRRQAALDLLKVESGNYHICPETWGIKEAYTANLTENLGREDLTTYEIAAHCAKMKDLGLTAQAIARDLQVDDGNPEGKSPMSEKHIGNMIRCANQLSSKIIGAWKAQHPAASLRTMIKLSAIPEKSDQNKAWETLVNPPEVDAEGDDEGESPEKTKTRPGLASLAVMLGVLADSKIQTPAWRDGARAALDWASGAKVTLGGLKAKKPKKVKAAKSEKEE